MLTTMLNPWGCLRAIALLAYAKTSVAQAHCNSTFEPISASSFAAALNPDGIQETQWTLHTERQNGAIHPWQSRLFSV
jgi:hypothetical protein